MGKIVISENISLDGVIQDPTGDEGLPFGGWFNQLAETDRQEWAKIELAEAQNAEAILIGRRTYDYFAARWPTRTGEWADRLRSLPKYVISSTLANPEWENTTVLSTDVVNEVTKLKQAVQGDIVVYASSQLTPTLFKQNLVDEVRLMTYPWVLGAGTRLFPATDTRKPLRLLNAQTVGNSLALLTYQVVRDE